MDWESGNNNKIGEKKSSRSVFCPERPVFGYTPGRGWGRSVLIMLVLLIVYVLIFAVAFFAY